MHIRTKTIFTIVISLMAVVIANLFASPLSPLQGFSEVPEGKVIDFGVEAETMSLLVEQDADAHLAPEVVEVSNETPEFDMQVQECIAGFASELATQVVAEAEAAEAEAEAQAEDIDEESSSQYPISATEAEIQLVVQAVQHEVGCDPTYFQGYDFDVIQQCMAKVILNRVGRTGFADTIDGVIDQPGQFMPRSQLTKFSPTEERTRKNVIAVLNGDASQIPDNLIFEMSFTSSDVERNLGVMERQVGDVELYYDGMARSADGRYLYFAMQ